jgi:pimeloyl-ACP methyl ester carboxylesterase
MIGNISKSLFVLIFLSACGGPRAPLKLPADGIVRTAQEPGMGDSGTYPLEEGYVTAETTGVRLWYRRWGPKDAPAVILLNGSDFPANMWHPRFVSALLEAGLHVVQYDMRDCGRSERLKWPKGFKARKWTPQKPPPYPLTDLRDDLRGLMDALSIPQAHLIGISLGGMIAQLMAIDEPDRVKTLSLLSTSPSNSFDADIDNPNEEHHRRIGELYKKAAVAYYMSKSDKWKKRMAVAMQQITGASDDGADFKVLLNEIDELGEYNFMSGQGFAIASAPSRIESLSRIKSPTLILHGTKDPWFRYSHAELLHKHIPNSSLISIEGEGHALPRDMYNSHVGDIIAHLKESSPPSDK